MMERTATATPLSAQQLRQVVALWRAANYLSAGQIYLLDNPLLREPLRPEQIKPRLLGHWGTTPGLNFLYAHLNRAIIAHELDMMYVIGPGHGGPALFANTWLEGSYSASHPEVTQDLTGMRALFRQFSFPGGVPSHVAPEVPGSIHEGGELGYSLAHAYGAALDNPSLIVACVVGICPKSGTGPGPECAGDECRGRAARRCGCSARAFALLRVVVTGLAGRRPHRFGRQNDFGPQRQVNLGPAFPMETVVT